VFLMDFDPWIEELTDSLLFSWEELNQEVPNSNSNTNKKVELRIVENQNGIVPSSSLRHRLPFDLVDVSSNSAIQDFAINFSQK
jgi:hypothetical protein